MCGTMTKSGFKVITLSNFKRFNYHLDLDLIPLTNSFHK